MCIIAYKPAGKAMFSADLVKNMFENNPDGAGFMYAKDGKVHYAKGYMSLDDLNKALDALKKKVDLASVPLVMHFRISTQGGVDESLCHPFPVCSSYASMRKLKGTCDCAIAHNGIISYASTYASYDGGYYRSGNYVVHTKTKEPDYNDTMTYIKKYFYPISKGRSDWYMDKDLVSFFSTDHMLGGNRLAILSGDGHLEWLGSKVKHDGYIFSNSSYEERKPVLETIPSKAGTKSRGPTIRLQTTLISMMTAISVKRTRIMTTEASEDLAIMAHSADMGTGTTNHLSISEKHAVFAVINGAFGKRCGLVIKYDRLTDTNYFLVNGKVTELCTGMLILERRLEHEPERYTTRQNATMMREAFRKVVGRDIEAKPR